MSRTRRQSHVGGLIVPLAIRDYVEHHQDRLTIEQTAFDTCNGYALGIGSVVRIERFVEYCPICGYDSYSNPSQKRLTDERRHKLQREWKNIFEWEDYSPDAKTLDEAFAEFCERSA